MTPPQRYLALGDSFTIGTGTTPDRSFPAVLVALWRKRGRQVALTNPAVNGYTTEELIARELPFVLRVRPTVVTLLIGSNDIVRGSDADRYRARLRSIHTALLDAGVTARAIHALPQPDWSLSPSAQLFGDQHALRSSIDAFNAVAREEVERIGGTFIDLFPLMRDQADQGKLAPDRLHPSAEAYAEWAAALVDRL
ncbi:MAG TPA: SGNH/GDSL hydrolase family protein [Candidatus Limnocylindria bacterium]